MPAVFCYGLCHMSIQEFTECYLTHKKARLCAVMSMWLVHIKEHVWSIGYAQPPSFYLWASRGVKCCAGGLNEKEVWPCMRGQPVCSPGSWSGRGWLPLKKWKDSEWKVARAVKSCEAHSIILQVFYSALYQVPNLLLIIIVSNSGMSTTNTPPVFFPLDSYVHNKLCNGIGTGTAKNCSWVRMQYDQAHLHN